MNIYLFSGVPFTNEYKNTYGGNDLLDKLIDNNYLLAEVSSIAKYNIITSTLVVPKEYINCNYVAITSIENNVQRTLFYFVINIDVSSTSSITLMLEKDAFHSHYNQIDIKNSKVIQTNLMHQLYNVSNYTIPSDKLICESTPSERTLLHNNTPEWTLIAVITMADDVDLNYVYSNTNKYIVFRSGSYTDMVIYKNLLMAQQFTKTTETITPSTKFYSFQIFELYIIPYSNCITYDIDNDIYVPIDITTSSFMSFHRPSIFQPSSIALYSITKRLSPCFKYSIGVKSNNVLIDGNGGTIDITIRLFIDNYGSVNIILQYGENLLDITNDLKVDVYTNEYYLWKNQNANQLKAQNTTNYINGVISIASSSVALGVGVGTGSVNGIASGTLGIAKSITDIATTNMNRKAVLKDAKQKLPSRNDITTANNTYIYDYGIYIEQYTPINIDDILDDINWYGFLFTSYDTNIKTNIATALNTYAYINIQCDDVNIICNDCDIQSLNTIKDIFNSGVRIWASINKSTILKQIEQVNTIASENAV